jgi:hypothetical protein
MSRLMALLVALSLGLACGRVPADLAGVAAYYARGYGLDPDLLIALVWVETASV